MAKYNYSFIKPTYRNIHCTKQILLMDCICHSSYVGGIAQNKEYVISTIVGSQAGVIADIVCAFLEIDCKPRIKPYERASY